MRPVSGNPPLGLDGHPLCPGDRPQPGPGPGPGNDADGPGSESSYQSGRSPHGLFRHGPGQNLPRGKLEPLIGISGLNLTFSSTLL